MTTLSQLDGPTDEWAEEHRWRQGDVFELLVPRHEEPRAMMLPVWGWAEAVYRYRLLWRPEDADTIDEMAFDIFEGPGGRVLVVQTSDGFEDRVDGVCGDYMQDRGSQVWEAPARVAEPPRHLVDVGTRSDVQNWLVDGVAPVMARWAISVDMSATGLIEQASVLDVEELSDWLIEAAERGYDEATFGWPQRNITVSKTPRMVAHYPSGRYRSGNGTTWAFAWDGCVAEQDFLLVFFCEKTKFNELEQRAQVVWGREVEQAITAKGEEDGLLALIGWQLFDWHAATLDTSIPF
jgi:hypothetical protein